MITVLKNARVYAPEDLGHQNVVLCGEKIIELSDNTELYEKLPQAEVYDCAGNCLVPGFLDVHEHILGGGGEDGPASRVREAGISDILAHGVTTVLGLLGVDGTSRSVENLVTKARALTADGLTCCALTSNYCYPNTTITGSVEKDIMMIDPIVGVKTSLSDHRDSNLSCEELIRMASDARRGGLLSGKAGLVVVHIGRGKRRLEKLLYAVKNSDVPIKHLLPTHVNLHDDEVLKQSEEFIALGGTVDYTAGFNEALQKKTVEIMNDFYRRHGTLEPITLSSDAYGSCPEYDEHGAVVAMKYSTPMYLPRVLADLVSEKGVPMEEALKPLTTNPARVLALAGRKGRIAVGADADILILDGQLRVHTLFARGRLAVERGTVLLRGVYGDA